MVFLIWKDKYDEKKIYFLEEEKFVIVATKVLSQACLHACILYILEWGQRPVVVEEVTHS